MAHVNGCFFIKSSPPTTSVSRVFRQVVGSVSPQKIYNTPPKHASPPHIFSSRDVGASYPHTCSNDSWRPPRPSRRSSEPSPSSPSFPSFPSSPSSEAFPSSPSWLHSMVNGKPPLSQTTCFERAHIIDLLPHYHTQHLHSIEEGIGSLTSSTAGRITSHM